MTKSLARKNNGNCDDGTVELRFVHVCDGRLGGTDGRVDDICCATVYVVRAIHGHVEVNDVAVG